MLVYETYYDREARVWWGYWASAKTGHQIGESINAHKKEDCLIQLGMVYDDRYRDLMETEE